MTVIKNHVVNAGNNPIMLQGTLALRPVFGVTGRIYTTTDTQEIFRDTGIAWELISSGGGGSQNLQQVTTLGNETTNSIIINDETKLIGLFNASFIGTSYGYDIISSDVDLRIATSDNNGNNVFTTNGTLKVLDSGTYTPTLTPSSNCAAVALVYANYLRVGNVVTVSILMNVTPTLGGFNTGVQAITLPVSFSTYNRYQARGVVYDTITQNVVAVSGFNSGSSSTTIFFAPVANNVQSVSIEIVYSGTP